MHYGQEKEQFCDERDGKRYVHVTIGGQVWMAENLNYDIPGGGSHCYNDDPSNCLTYGRLYNWAAAMDLSSSCNSNTCSGQINSLHRGICPAGWHIPSNAELDVLANSVGGQSVAGNELKSEILWDNRNGIDSYGFTALPGGCGNGGVSGGLPELLCSHEGDPYSNIHDNGVWWNANEPAAVYAYLWMMLFNDDALRSLVLDKPVLASVRCIKD
jgi:uncharacterized protein (TIGR02145 family)